MHVHPASPDLGEGEPRPLFCLAVLALWSWPTGFDAKASLWIREGVIAEPRLESWIARNVPAFHSSEKGFEGFIKSRRKTL